MDAFHGRVGLVLRQPAFLHSPREVSPVGLSRFVELRRFLVLQRDVDAGERRLLRDLSAHRSRADDGKSRQLTEKMRVTEFSVARLPSMPSMRSLPRSSFAATPRPTSS